MNLKPTGNKILVKPSPPPDVTAGGVIVPVAWQKPSGDGTVLAVGPGRINRKGLREPTGVNVGDKVMYRWLDGVEVEVDGEPCKILHADQLIGVMA